MVLTTVTIYEGPASPFLISRSVSRMFVVALLLALEPLRHRSPPPPPLSNAKETLAESMKQWCCRSLPSLWQGALLVWNGI